MIMWIISNWSVLIWGVPFLVGFLFVWHLLGWKFASPIAGAGVAVLIWFASRKNTRDNYKKMAQDIEEKREQAYEKIDNRNTTASDVAERLRNGDY